MAGRHALLIVEDDADLRRMFRAVLAIEGFEVREAADGLDAVKRIDEDPSERRVHHPLASRAWASAP